MDSFWNSEVTNFFNGGTCWSSSGFLIVSYAGSCVQVTTDWVSAIVPFFIIGGLQMPRRTKVSVIAVLGLGIFASIAALIRMPYYKYYEVTKYPNNYTRESSSRYVSFPRPRRRTKMGHDTTHEADAFAPRLQPQNTSGPSSYGPRLSAALGSWPAPCLPSASSSSASLEPRQTGPPLQNSDSAAQTM